MQVIDQTPQIHHLRRDWRLFSSAVFLFAFGFGVYTSVFINYITEILKVQPVQMGMLESMREIPGLLAVGIAGMLASFPENRVGAGSLALSALGVAATGYVHNFTSLVVVTVFWSVFMHQWFTTSSAIPLALAAEEKGGRHLGRMGAVGAGAAIVAFILVHFLVGHITYAAFFTLAGASILIGGLLLMPMSSLCVTYNRKRLLYRREYRVYYLLSFLEGCRRQIFTTFAIFALVQACHTPLSQIAALMLFNAIATFTVASPVGKLIDKIGERRAMTIYYIAIAIAFTGYALAQTAPLLKVLYVLDNMLFSFGVSITTYLHRIVRPGEMSPSLSMGQTMNHIAAVAIPVTGGLLWNKFGYHAPFWVGVVAALISLAVTQKIAYRLVDETVSVKA